MRDQSTAVADRASSVVCDHPDDVAEVQALANYCLAVRFFDGTAGTVDLSELIASAQAGVFSALRDRTLFEQVGIVLGAVTWPNGIDLAPDAMHEALQRSPEWRIAG